MLRFANFVLLTALVCDVQRSEADAPELADDFTCYPNQTIHFNNPNPGLLINYRAFYNDGSGDQDCTPNTPDNHLNVYYNSSSTSCWWGRKGRALSEEDGYEADVITSSQRLIIKEAVLGGSSRANGLPGLTVAMLIMLHV